MITVGRDVRGAAAITAKVNDVIKLLSGTEATFTDPAQAGWRLGALLDEGPRRLLVLDDVWCWEQLEPFMMGGARCARLITTRVPGLVRSSAVVVDQMSPTQARRLLTGGLPLLDPAVVDGLLEVTGNWPLLLRLVNKILINAAAADPTAVSKAGAWLLERLRAEGPAAADRLLGMSTGGVDVGNPRERELAVRTTVDASRLLLDRADADRFAELAVFAEDEVMPVGLVALLWDRTARLDRLEVDQVLARLAGLGLVTIQAEGRGDDAAGGMVVVHGVVRDLLRAEAGPAVLAKLNRVLAKP